MELLRDQLIRLGSISRERLIERYLSWILPSSSALCSELEKRVCDVGGKKRRRPPPREKAKRHHHHSVAIDCVVANDLSSIRITPVNAKFLAERGLRSDANRRRLRLLVSPRLRRATRRDCLRLSSCGSGEMRDLQL